MYVLRLFLLEKCILSLYINLGVGRGYLDIYYKLLAFQGLLSKVIVDIELYLSLFLQAAVMFLAITSTTFMSSKLSQLHASGVSRSKGYNLSISFKTLLKGKNFAFRRMREG